MGLVAVQTRLMMGKRYKAGDPVDTTDWPSGTAERLQTFGLLAWVEDEEKPKRKAAPAKQEAEEPEPAEAPEGAEAGEGAEEGEEQDEGEDGGDQDRPVAVNQGHGWYLLPDGSKMQGRQAVEAAGYLIDDSEA